MGISIGVWIWGAQGAVSLASLLAGPAVDRPCSAARRYDEQVRAHPLFTAANRGGSPGGWTAYFALAATVTALTTPWSGLAFALPTPLLGWASFRIGERYADRRVPSPTTKGTTDMTPTPEQDLLRSMISGKTDDEILVLLREAPGGAAAVLETTMAGMADALDPDNAQDCVVGYEIDTEGDTVSYRIEVRGTRLSRRPGARSTTPGSCCS